MTKKARDNFGKYIALILRHRPDVIGITLDNHGWAKVDDLVLGINATKPFTREMLEEVVEHDNKNRYSFDESKTHIRANQGHSIHVDVELAESTPQPVLYHGTATKYCQSIEENGLIPKSRLHVHLSQDIKTAINVGQRHGAPVVYEVDAQAMLNDGYKFYLSVNGVWLTDSVPARYLTKQEISIKTYRFTTTPNEEQVKVLNELPFAIRWLDHRTIQIPEQFSKDLSRELVYLFLLVYDTSLINT